MDVGSRAQQSFIDSIRLFARHSAVGFVDQVGGWEVLATGLPVSILNAVVPSLGRQAPDGLGVAMKLVGDANLLYSVVLVEGQHIELERPLSDLGFVESRRLPVMAGSGLLPKAWPSELEVSVGSAALADHADVLAASFGLPVAMAQALSPPSLGNDPAVDVVVGSLEGEPVVTAIGVTANGTTGVYNVATTPEVRGRGFGTAATYAIVEAGIEKGASLSVLQSTPMGFSVYESMGYETVGTQVHYTLP